MNFRYHNQFSSKIHSLNSANHSRKDRAPFKLRYVELNLLTVAQKVNSLVSF